jgi:IS5 family transposase
MLKKEDSQLKFYDDLLERLVPQDHVYRRLSTLIDYSVLLKPFEACYSKKGAGSEPLTRSFKGLLLQFWEDLSDRQLEKYLQENNTAKWFCGYGLEEKTPDHSYYGKLRKRLGVEKLRELFNTITESIKQSGYVGGAFTFVDASSMIAKVNIWKARDKAIVDKQNEEKDDDDKPQMNNNNISKYSPDPDAKYGCKGKNKFWLGYKRHHQVDMSQGIITDVKVTSGDVTDAKAFVEEDLCPESGMVFLDKGYDSDAVDINIKEKGCADRTIRKKNRKFKNKELDRWRSSVRMPYESTFSKVRKNCRYRGIKK